MDDLLSILYIPSGKQNPQKAQAAPTFHNYIFAFLDQVSAFLY